MLDFSLLVPTRGRPQIVQRLFQSIVDTAADLSRLEIILGVDEDDAVSQALTHERLTVRHVVCPKGVPLGVVTCRSFEQAQGRFIAQVTDDVVMRTPNWDRIVLAAFSMFPDDIALIHVNDLLFREQLCTFPILSRRACAAIGPCPTHYQRYRNDDHIYDTYNLLAHLGYKRIVYLEEVIFEHKHYVTDLNGYTGNFFKSRDNKFYVTNDAIMAVDAKVFDEKLPERKDNAMKLARLIDASRCERLAAREGEELKLLAPDRRARVYASLLGSVRDSFHYRRPDFLRRMPAFTSQTARTPRTTVLVVTADLRRDYAQRCLALLKDHTCNYDLMLLDNNGGGDFAHSREINKALRTVENDFLVLMDDDVFVEPGWLDRLIAHATEDTGVVCPMHTDKDGAVSYSGAYLAGDGLGTHVHHLDRLTAPRDVQCVCTACVLVDMRKVGHVFMDEAYNKYFFDLVYGLRVWEEGFRCRCAHDVTVTHLGGATMLRGTGEASGLWDRDRAVFVEEWVRSGRLARLEQGIWRQSPFMQALVDTPREFLQIGEQLHRLPAPEIKRRLAAVLPNVMALPLFKEMLEERLRRWLPWLQEYDEREKATLVTAILMWMNGATPVRPPARRPALECVKECV